MYDVPVLDMGRVVEFVNEHADRPRVVADEQDMPYPEMAVPSGDLVPAANAAFEVFAAAPDGRAFERLNDLLRAARPLPVATEAGLRWTVDAPENVLPAALGACLLEWLVNHGQERLGTCHGAKCVDVYADASPAGRRRFCSSTCLNRHKVAAYRQRAR
ncbi:CGNR zinc finger domain-containing protein [Amycolatopsis suaedae]|uniref:CGNR zinc finger domain-containing protein n=1 Tax=Amycolatopsis suaedae TaxID=2510978 RepID=A0A4Q7JBE9_9PSEU|nr:CGNR zinc finger domain-containing protein [Amycolatopsis suaedae]RZQ65150.1 CGNR zinc finger domain-containing protein [Amycolatopsis suaedae]